MAVAASAGAGAAACSSRASGGGGSAAAPAEADPAKVTAAAQAMLANAPSPGARPPCTPADLAGGLPMTQVTLLRLGGKPVASDPEHAPWINPAELDGAAARALLAAAPGSVDARRAAAAWLAAPFYVVYRVDNVDAPLALGVKELKIGTIGARVIRYDRSGDPRCVTVFAFQDDRAVSDWAIAKSDHALVDPAVSQRLQADLGAQLLRAAPRVDVAPAPPTAPPAP